MTPTEREAEKIIEKEIGLKPGRSLLTPMDYGECLRCIESAITAWHDKVRNQAIQDCIDTLVDDIKIPVTSSWLEKLEQLKTKP